MSLMGYTEEEVIEMIWAIEVAYELIDGAPKADKYLMKARDLLHGLLVEGRV